MQRLSLWLISLASCLFLLTSTVVLIRNTHWEHALGEPMPTEGYAVGPIRSGESAEQTFIAPGSYLSGIDVAVRPHEDTRDPLELQFRLRQVNDGQVVREGRVTVQPDPARLRQTVSWRFQIIPESAGRRYTIAVIPAEDANGHVFLPISLEDPLDGTLATNGQLAGG